MVRALPYPKRAQLSTASDGGKTYKQPAKGTEFTAKQTNVT